MKLFSLILVGLMLYLTGVPCDDIELTKSTGIEYFNLTQESHNSCEHPLLFDGCSPFCICNCCHTNVVIPQNTIEKSIATLPGQDLQFYLQDFYPNGIFFAIWRPPQSV